METILTVKEESMIAVADAVRDKAGVEGSLSFPNGMVAAINSIKTGGSNIAIDNKTIIEEDGVIRTVVGGYYADPVPGEMLYENNNNITLTYAHHENLNCWFDGYFALPNWSPIGEEHLGKTLRLTWYETPYPDSPDYVIECFADAFLLDENLQTIIVVNIENTEMVGGSIDNNTGYLSCMPHIYENPDDWERSYVSNFRIEVPESDGGAVPIGSEFIPQEVWEGIGSAATTAWDAHSRANDAHTRINDLENRGGGSANIDNLTIITNENGQIRTTIGGGYTMAPGESYYHENDIDIRNVGYYLPNWTPVPEEWIGKTFTVHMYFIYSTTEYGTLEEALYSYCATYDGVHIILDAHPHWMNNFIRNSDGYWDPNSDVINDEDIDGCYFYTVEIIAPEQKIYDPIEAGFIPVDNETITVQDGRLVAAGGSGGSSVNVDGITIIEEDGVIKTALGGGKILSVPGEEFYNYTDEVGITNRQSGNNRMNLPNYPASTIFILKPSLNYDFEIHLRNAETGYIDIMTGYTKFIDNYEVSLIGNTTITDTTISIDLYNPSEGYLSWNNGSNMFEKYYITYISFKKQDQYEYNKIDSNYIKLGNGLNVNATGEIIVESNLANLSGDSTRNIILQSTNTQSTGSIENSAAFGYKNQLGGQGSISLGRENKQSSGAAEITIGDANEVSSYQNFVFGMKNKALDYSGNVIVGSNNYSKQSNSFIGGSYLQASKANQTLYGTYNKLDADAAVVIGCGDSSTRKNGLVISSDQVAHFPGSVVIGENKDEVATKAYINEVLGVIENGTY